MLTPPGPTRPRLTQIRRSARPIVAFARQPGPSAPAAELMSSAVRAGPLTTKTGATASVVPDTPTRLKPSPQSASTPAITAGRYSGRQPAITAFTAIRSTVARPKAGATRAIRSSARKPEAAIAASTRSRVGGTTGKPSVTPRANSCSIASSALTAPTFFHGPRFGRQGFPIVRLGPGGPSPRSALRLAPQPGDGQSRRARSARQVRGAVRAPLRVDRNRRRAPGTVLGPRRRGGGLREPAINLLDQQEDGERHDHEINHRVQEQPVVERRGARGLRSGERRIGLPRQADEEVLEVRAPEEPPDRRHQDIVDERGDDGAEARADDHADREVDDATAHDERLERAQHGPLLLPQVLFEEVQRPGERQRGAGLVIAPSFVAVEAATGRIDVQHGAPWLLLRVLGDGAAVVAVSAERVTVFSGEGEHRAHCRPLLS